VQIKEGHTRPNESVEDRLLRLGKEREHTNEQQQQAAVAMAMQREEAAHHRRTQELTAVRSANEQAQVARWRHHAEQRVRREVAAAQLEQGHRRGQGHEQEEGLAEAEPPEVERISAASISSAHGPTGEGISAVGGAVSEAPSAVGVDVDATDEPRISLHDVMVSAEYAVATTEALLAAAARHTAEYDALLLASPDRLMPAAAVLASPWSSVGGMHMQSSYQRGRGTPDVVDRLGKWAARKVPCTATIRGAL
jgi:hypothetical protein